MSFLSGIFLLALPLSAVPVALHLLRRHQRQVISWGAMQFLSDAIDKGRRFDRLEEWLLLALRAVALLALVLALARPMVRGLTPQISPVAEVVVVIDDSLSTDRRVATTTAYDLILDKARRYIEDCSAGETVRVMLAADGPRWLLDEPTEATVAGKRHIHSALDDTHPTRGAANFLGCLRLVASFESDEENVDRKVVVFTDGQAKGWQVEARGVWDRLRAATDQAPRTIDVEVATIDVPPSLMANLSLDSVIASRRVLAEREPVVFTAKITNTGRGESQRSSITWSVDDKRQGEMDLTSIAPGQTKSVEWRSSLDQKGAHDVAATAKTSDLLSLDNETGVVVEVVEAIPILVLAATTKLDEAENTFFATALGYDQNNEPAASDQWRSLYRPTFLRFADVENENLGKYHAVVINGLGELSSAATEKLETFVRDGGGLWLMLGSRIDRDIFNRRWYSDGAGLIPLPLNSLMKPADRDSAEAAIHPPPGDHPATAMLADINRLDIDRVRFQKYHTFRRPPGQEFTPLLESGRGEPLAVLHQLGKGRVIVQAYPLRTDWSDLAISKSFVVLVQDWLTYLTQPAATRFNLSSREPFTCQPLASIVEKQVQVTLPDGSTTDLRPIDGGGGQVYRFSQTNLPGRYQLRFTSSGADRMIPFRVARDAAESVFAPLRSEDIAMLKEVAGIHFDSASRPSDSVRAEHSRLGPAWWPLLIGLVCLMAGESLLARRVSKGRFGAVTAEA